jgi:hypothetical protein
MWRARPAFGQLTGTRLMATDAALQNRHFTGEYERMTFATHAFDIAKSEIAGPFPWLFGLLQNGAGF